MRAVALVLLAACGGGSQAPCKADSDCSGDVCARNGECVSASEIQMVKVTWTVNGGPANATSCAPAPDLELWFDSAQDYFGFEPVPCMEGQFTIDKIPVRYDSVELDKAGGTPVGFSPIPASLTVAFNLQL